jgi:predicted membrane protein (TIGR00267 family)
VLGSLPHLLDIARPLGIMRRYSIVNGFDGALTMLGLTLGFRIAGEPDVGVALTACFAAALALSVSGVSSAFVSEAAERQKELAELERAMMADLSGSAHGTAARLVPVMIAIVNGLAPLAISLIIIAPLWLASIGLRLPWSPYDMSLVTAFAVIFGLGAFLGRMSGLFWFWSALRALLIGAVAVVLILLVAA